jgi:hypothetical protein
MKQQEGSRNYVTRSFTVFTLWIRLLRQKLIVAQLVVFFKFYHGVRLSPLGTVATVWAIILAPDDR